MRYLLPLLLWATPAFASVQPLMMGPSALNTTSTVFNAVHTIGTSGTPETARATLHMSAGKLWGLEVGLLAGVTPGSGKSYSFTVRINLLDTALLCTISGSDSTCVNTTDIITIANQDWLSLEITPSGTPTGGNFIATVYFTPTTENDALFGGTGGTANSSSAPAGRSYPICFILGPTTDPNNLKCQLSSTGTLSNLGAYFDTAPGAGKSYAVTLWHSDDGAGNTSTPITCTVSGTSNECTDAVNTFAVDEGDNMFLFIVPSGTPAVSRHRFGLRFVPAVAGEFIVPYHNTSMDVLNTDYGVFKQLTPSVASATSAPTFASRIQWKQPTVQLVSNPGSGKSFTATFQTGGTESGNRDPSIVLANTAGPLTEAESTMTPSGVQALWKIVPSGTPTGGRGFFAITGQVGGTWLDAATLDAATLQ